MSQKYFYSTCTKKNMTWLHNQGVIMLPGCEHSLTEYLTVGYSKITANFKRKKRCNKSVTILHSHPICTPRVIILTADVRGFRAKVCNDVNIQTQLDTQALSRTVFHHAKLRNEQILPPLWGIFVLWHLCLCLLCFREKQNIFSPSLPSPFRMSLL